MQLTFANDRFEAVSSFAEKDLVKGAGFRWDPTVKRWWTKDATLAGRFLHCADAAATTKLNRVKATVEASRATNANVTIPAPDGLDYMPFQKAGIVFASERDATLIGDEMGLGKTIQGIGVVNLDPTAKRVLVITKAALKVNWKLELEKWLVRPMTVGIADSKVFPDTAVVVINYDILHKHPAALRAVEWDVLIIDECHALKNAKARRTKQVFGANPTPKEPKGTAAIKARRRLLLTGTPILNKPAELFPLLHYLDPVAWPKFFPFAMRYCSAVQGKWGWDFSGASHLDELQLRLRGSLMVRRLKADVLTELPAKVRQVIELPANGCAGVISDEQKGFAAQQENVAALRAAAELAKASDDEEEYRAAVDALKKGITAMFNEMSRLRHATAVAKIPYVVGHLTDIFEEDDRKVICFAHHRDVVSAIGDAFGEKAVILTGDTKPENRQRVVDEFMDVCPDCRQPATRHDDTMRCPSGHSFPRRTLFIGNIQAAGEGITLTIASHVVFAELDWVPGKVTQAEDRAHRIGQRASVFIQHLVLEGSLDATMAKRIVDKQRIIDKALDTGVEFRNDPIVPGPDAATGDLSRKKVAEAAALLPENVVGAVHRGLQILAGMCDGAQLRDNVGFNGLDTRIGKSLAMSPRLSPKQAVLGRKLLVKYCKTQLPPDVAALVLG